MHPGMGSSAHLKCGALRSAPPNPTKSPPGSGDWCREFAPILCAVFSLSCPRFAAMCKWGAFLWLALTPSSHPTDLGADPGAGQLG